MENPSILSKYTPKELGRWTLMSMKSEIVLYSLRQSLYWQSLMEIGLMASALILLLLRGKFMILLHILHGVRPVIAYMIIIKLPQLLEIYKELPESLEGSNTMFEGKLYDQVKKCNKFISIYLIATGISAVLDLLGLFVDISGLGGESNSVVFYSIVAWVFLCFDLYIFLWFFSLQLHFPNDTWETLLTLAKANLKETSGIALSIQIQRAN